MKRFRSVLVIIGGVIYLLFGLLHVSFIFSWKNELVNISEMYRGVLQMLNIGLVVFLLSFGFFMLYFRRDILESRLGKAILIASSLFFFIRLIEGVIFPGGSMLFGIILLLCTLVYLIPAFTKDMH